MVDWNWTGKHDEAIITVRWSYFFGLFTGKPRKYIGSSTVWHTYPDFERASTNEEISLSSIWRKARHERTAA